MSDRAADELLRRVQAGRERWLDLDARHAVKIRRPAEATWPALRAGGLPALLGCVVDWRGPGFTVGGILGDAAQPEEAEKPATFSSALWLEMAMDRAAWCAEVAEAITADVATFAAKREAAAGN